MRSLDNNCQKLVHHHTTMTTTATANDLPTDLTMPAEWHPHEACLILYPHNAQTYRLPLAQAQIDELAQAIAFKGNEKVLLFCNTKDDAQKLSEKEFVVSSQGKIQVHVCPSTDTWARDTAPTFCVHKNTNEVVGIDWGFNGYGGPEEGCYWPCEEDQQIAKHMCQKILHKTVHSIPLILEGGSIHSDGEGTILTTKECLLNPNRNPGHTQQEIEQILLQTLGAEKVIWLPNGVDADEDTNGHIDNFCCFVQPGHVILAWTDDEVNDGENYKRCRTALDVLDSSKDAQGRSLVVHKLYLPPPMVSHVCFCEEEKSGVNSRLFDTNLTFESNSLALLSAMPLALYQRRSAIAVGKWRLRHFATRRRENGCLLYQFLYRQHCHSCSAIWFHRGR
jgi:agmatine deiminase